MEDRYRIIGANASPYSVKLRAIMRYRRLPFTWEIRNVGKPDPETAHLKPFLVPVLRFPEDGSFHMDSTPLAYALEKRHRERSIIPDDPGLGFLCHLIEDMADEWGTKPMFHYRWARPEDQDYCARWIVEDTMPSASQAQKEQAIAAFKDRQMGRMPIVGCTPENAPVIEESYHRVIDIYERHIKSGQGPYLFGSRPSLADFGWFGQLLQLATDPTPQKIMRQRAPLTESWVRRLEDASGVDGEWIHADGKLPEGVMDMLHLAGNLYLPFLAANARAVEEGAESFSMTLLGRPYSQGSFKYQAKCLKWLQEELEALKGSALERVQNLLKETGCWDHLAP
jgi:glutathione S-transferase